MRGSNSRTYLFLVFVQVAFAAGAVEGKLAMAPGPIGGNVSPFALAMARMMGAAAFFQIASRFRRDASQPTFPEHARLLGLSVLGVVLNQGLFLVGLSRTSAFSAALLAATIPVFTAILAVLFRHEKGSLRMAVGLVLAVTGVAWLTGLRAVDRGALIVTANCFAYALYLVLARKTIQRLGALTVITWIFTYGMLLFAPLGGAVLLRDVAAWSTRSWVLVGFMVIAPTIFAYAANAWALGRASSSVVAVFVYLQPVLAALLAFVQLGQGLTSRMLTATFFIFAGVSLVLLRPSRPSPPAGSDSTRSDEVLKPRTG